MSNVPASPARQDFWSRLRAERRRRAIEDVARHAGNLADELAYLTSALDPGSEFHDEELTPEKLGRRIADLASDTADIARELSVIVNQEALMT